MSRARALWQRVPALVIDLALVAAAAVDVRLTNWEPTHLELALAAVGCTALAFRRRFPLVVFLLTLPIALMQDVAVAVLVALFTLAERSRNRRLLAVCVALSAIASSTPWPSMAQVDRTMTLVFFVYGLATAAVPVLFGQLLQAQRDLARRLAEIEEAREHERALHAQAVLARERAQLAREMHDVVSHQVSLIAVRAGALQVGTQDAEVKEAAATIRRLSVQTLDELRHMVSVLRAAGGRPTELTPQPSLADLERLVSGSGIEADLQPDLPDGLPPTVQRAVYRTVQEALTNVRKHAPGASARVRIHHQGGTVRVTVTNTAPTRPALPLPSAHYGLVGLRQRAALLGGTVTSGPTADGGYELRLDLPDGACSADGLPPA